MTERNLSFTRRDFLRYALGAGLIAASGFLFFDVVRPSKLAPAQTEALKVLLDTLIPEDESPGALRLGVAKKIISKTAEDSDYRTTVKAGCRWLDKMARKHGEKRFQDLTGRDRDLVIGEALNSAYGSLPLIFMENVRSDAFYYYYGHPAAWGQLAYPGPPQPNGFPDYNKRPLA